MAGSAEDKDAPEGEEGAKPGKPLPLIIAVVNMVLIVLIGAMFLLKEDAPPPPAEGEDAEKAEDPNASAGPGPEWKLSPPSINLNEPSGNRYLKATMFLELTSKKTEEEIEAKKNRVLDTSISYLSSLRYADTVGENGKSRIRRDLTKQINGLLETGKIRRIYFTEFIVQ